MSEKENGLAGWQKAIQELSNYEPTDKYVLAIHRIKELEQELAAMTDLAIIKDRAIDLNLKELADAKKDQARYQYVRNMLLEDFSGIKGDYTAFDKAIDAAIKESSK